jgi:squalene synthase HpnD
MTTAAAAPPNAQSSPEEITARSGSSFLAGFACLAPERRRGMTAIYAFCRVVDDAVDEAADPDTASAHLAFWRAELAAAAAGTATTPVGAAVMATMQRFGVEARFLGDLLDGVATDLTSAPFADEQQLDRYCYRVASAVGLACLPVLGATSPGARTFATALGHALQRTNILRDLREDAEDGRCYVPQPWLAADGVDPEWLRGQGPDAVYADGGPIARIRARLAAAAAAHFAQAQAALRALPRGERRALAPARIMGAIYGELLVRLRRRGGDVRGPRLRVGRANKLWLALLVLAGVRA